MSVLFISSFLLFLIREMGMILAVNFPRCNGRIFVLCFELIFGYLVKWMDFNWPNPIKHIWSSKRCLGLNLLATISTVQVWIGPFQLGWWCWRLLGVMGAGSCFEGAMPGRSWSPSDWYCRIRPAPLPQAKAFLGNFSYAGSGWASGQFVENLNILVLLLTFRSSIKHSNEPSPVNLIWLMWPSKQWRIKSWPQPPSWW